MSTIVSPQTQNPNQQWDIIGQNNVELLAKTGFLLVLGIGLGIGLDIVLGIVKVTKSKLPL